jgi:hypothetical protein
MYELDKRQNDYGVFLNSLCAFTQRKTIVEIGVASGYTTFHLCKAAKITGGHVYGFDCWDFHGLQNQFGTFSTKESVESTLIENGQENFTMTQINTRTETEKFDNILKNTVKKIDFAFIDGCHSYIGIKTDFLAVKPYLAEDAIVAFHDTEFIDGVREFIIDLRTKYNDGTFDLLDFPYGIGDQIFGIAIMIYRKLPRPNTITEICGSISNPEQIYQKEENFYKSNLKTIDYSI